MSKTLVFGASLKPDRYSNLAVKRLLDHNFETEAFGLKEGSIREVKVRIDLNDMPTIDTVTLYLGKKRQSQYYNEIIKIRPKRVIFNPGTENREFSNLLKNNGIAVENACTLTLLATNQF